MTVALPLHFGCMASFLPRLNRRLVHRHPPGSGCGPSRSLHDIFDMSHRASKYVRVLVELPGAQEHAPHSDLRHSNKLSNKSGTSGFATFRASKDKYLECSVPCRFEQDPLWCNNERFSRSDFGTPKNSCLVSVFCLENACKL